MYNSLSSDWATSSLSLIFQSGEFFYNLFAPVLYIIIGAIILIMIIRRLSK